MLIHCPTGGFIPLVADLHTHTRHSDGALTPKQLVLQAKSLGMGALSITDHDNIDGIEEAIQSGIEAGVMVVPGIELSVTWNDRELHILGYCFDVQHPLLIECLHQFREQRFIRAKAIISKLNKMNIPLTLEMVTAKSGNGVLCRPHIAQALLENKFTQSYMEAFNKYIGNDCPAYEKMSDFPLEKAVKLISEIKGLSFLAHPGRSVSEKELFNIIEVGIDGLEVTHPSHSSDLQKYYRGIVNQYYLLESGGSDFHGGPRGDEKLFGKVTVPMKVIENMKHRLSQSYIHPESKVGT